MLKLIIILVLGILTIPYIQSQFSVADSTEQTYTQQTFSIDTTPVFTTDAQLTSPTDTPQTTISTDPQQSTSTSTVPVFSTDAQSTSTASTQQSASTDTPLATSTSTETIFSIDAQSTSTTDTPQTTISSDPQQSTSTSTEPVSITDAQSTSTASTQEPTSTDTPPVTSTSTEPTFTTDAQSTSTASTEQPTSTDTPLATSTSTEPIFSTDAQSTSTTDTPQTTISTDTQESTSTSTEPTFTTDAQSTSTTNTEQTISIDTQQTSPLNTESTFITDTESTLTVDTQPTLLTTTAVPFDSSVSSMITTSVTQESTLTSLLTADLTGSTISNFGSTTAPDTTTPISTETSEKTSTMSITSVVITSTTTKQPIIPLFRCDFTEACFGNGQLTITNGSEFNPPSIFTDTQPPRAPTSDVTATYEPTSDGEKCSLPYHPQLENSNETTTWNMSFCYHNQCPTKDESTAICAPGSYGLISLGPLETSKTVVGSLFPNVLLQDVIGEQCLRFYYYFTVYDQKDWGQQIQIWIRPNNQTDNQSSLLNLTFIDMTANKWEFKDQTFNTTSSSYTLAFVLEAGRNNRTDAPELNKTINFALDNLELYGYNCSYVRDSTTTLAPISTTIGPSQPAITTESPPQSTTPPSTTTTEDKAPAPPPSPSGTNWGMILGLSFGIGIPVLLIAIGGIILYKKNNRVLYDERYDIPLKITRLRSDSDIFKNPYLF